MCNYNVVNTEHLRMRVDHIRVEAWWPYEIEIVMLEGQDDER